MNKQDWIEYFEAVNSRSPETHELEAALAAGEFKEDDTSSDISQQEAVSQAEPAQSPSQEDLSAVAQDQSGIAPNQPTGSESGSAQTAQGSFTAQPGSNPDPAVNSQPAVAQDQSGIAQNQPVGPEAGTAQGSFSDQPAVAQSQSGIAQNQPTGPESGTAQGSFTAQPGFNPNQPADSQPGAVYGQQMGTAPVAPAQPSAFSLFIKQFWKWLLSALKRPTVDVESHKANGYLVLALVSLFATLTFLIPIWRLSLDYAGFLSFIITFFSFAAIVFSFVLGGFVVRRFIYGDSAFTFSRSIEWYGRLFASNGLLLAAATLFSLLNVSSLANIFSVLNLLVFGAAASYTLLQTGDRASKLDKFHKYLLACLVYFTIVFVIALLASSVSGALVWQSFGLSPFGLY